MRCSVLVPVVVAAALACAGERSAAPGPVAAGDAAVLKAAELARVRCLVVAPFENGSDAPLVSESATSTIVSDLDAARVRVFPVQELRWLFRDTPLELPPGIGPSLALELGALLGADAVLYGSVEGHSRGDAPELLVNVRLSLVPEHRLLFARTVLVTPAAGERIDSAVRRALLAAARPALSRLGDDTHRKCFDPERTRSLRRLAQAVEAKPAAGAAGPPSPPANVTATAPAPAPQPPSPQPSAPPALPPSAPAPIPARPPPAAPAPAPAKAIVRTPRQTEWAKRLARAERFVVEDVTFAGRSDDLQRDVGLADLAVALLAEPSASVRLEGFVDATSDPAADRKLAAAMAQAAAKELAALGVPRPRVTALGRGGESPRLPNFTARGRSANRRIEVVPLR